MNLHFLWREHYVDYLWASNVTAQAYFLHSGVLLYEDGVLTAYASDQELKTVQKTTAHLIKNPKKILQLKKEFQKMREKTNKMSPRYTKQNIQKVASKELYKLFLELLSLIQEMIVTYRLTEPHFVKHIEEMALNAVHSKLVHYKNPGKLFSRIVADKSCLLSKKYGIDTEGLKLIKLMHRVAQMRFKAKRTSFSVGDYAELLLRETARRTYLAIPQVSNLQLQELKSLLLEGKEPNLTSVNKRQKNFALKICMAESPHAKEVSNTELQNLIRYERDQSRVTSFKGSIAYPGKVVGVARVLPLISTTHEYKQYMCSLKKTDILIAPMTAPSLTRAFSIVKAVVTDEGGLMSHASLIAREKQIPCIIGTKIATRALHDGDTITVDANSGIVTKH
ncbi:MAG: hypothetical protein HY482_02565 [Candidatus Wildermuthbacteria bacterium]|nr:hypothetical protein [Candidatus Wildermuthbacteria bacterium]